MSSTATGQWFIPNRWAIVIPDFQDQIPVSVEESGVYRETQGSDMLSFEKFILISGSVDIENQPRKRPAWAYPQAMYLLRPGGENEDAPILVITDHAGLFQHCAG